MYHIYAIGEVGKLPVYVGVTDDLKRRWREHKSRVNTGNQAPLYQHIRDRGLDRFQMFVKQSTEEREHAFLLEEHWVSTVQGAGAILLNQGTGGPGSLGYKYDMPGPRTRDYRPDKGVMPMEQRARISATMKGVPKHDGFGQKVSDAMSGEKHPMSKLTREQAIEVLDRAWSGEDPRSIAEEFGINATQVRRIKNGDRWKNLPREQYEHLESVHPNRMLTDEQVVEMRRLHGEGYSYASVAEQFGLKVESARQICLGHKRKKAGTLG